MVGYVVIFKGIDHEDQEIAEATAYSVVGDFVEFTDENNAVLYRISVDLFGGCYRMGKARYIP